jgi:hypothetical protein
MRIDMFVPQDKVRPNVENIRGLNLVVAKLVTIEVTKLSL